MIVNGVLLVNYRWEIFIPAQHSLKMEPNSNVNSAINSVNNNITSVIYQQQRLNLIQSVRFYVSVQTES